MQSSEWLVCHQLVHPINRRNLPVRRLHVSVTSISLQKVASAFFLLLLSHQRLRNQAGPQGHSPSNDATSGQGLSLKPQEPYHLQQATERKTMIESLFVLSPTG